MNERFHAGREFLRREGRLLERRLFATCFEGASGRGVIEALRGYANDDGGFGHGLEPDKRCPASLPIDVECALAAMATAGVTDEPMIQRACDYLAGVSTGGAVPLAFPVIEGYPRAEHWAAWAYEPDVNPTAGIAGLLYELGVAHPWLAEAATYTWSRLDEATLPTDAHALRTLLTFLAHTPERDRATAAAATVRAALTSAAYFNLDPADDSYGLSPLTVAPSADSRWRALFADEVIEAHLDRMERDQQPDGGWPIAWDPPGAAARTEWRGIVTLANLRTLVSYGRIVLDG
ncbi:hypothetical protein [Asanoa siamensis]|uniref:Prenyltransferase and squalene oxidase repeat-containing protein n=1 Tax=Asanoa siamensis TaxID=926357 RepID=A0ABQ4CQ35_9ACTN|nr:hypothetical protein [Asanoa siamensis]GIF73395.1 hypothetical protein Asi02nite_29130 [Asanoa siamensis]